MSATTGSVWEPSIRSAATRTTTPRKAYGEPRSARTFDFGAYGKLSLDAIYTEDKGAVAPAALSAAANLKFPGTLAATISDNNSVMLLAKYTYHQLRVYAGYEYITFKNPSSPVTTGFTGIAGIPIASRQYHADRLRHQRASANHRGPARDTPSPPLSMPASPTTTTIRTAYGKAFCDNASVADLRRPAERGFVRRRLASSPRSSTSTPASCIRLSPTAWRTATRSSTTLLPQRDFVSGSNGREAPRPQLGSLDGGTRIKEAAPRAASFVLEPGIMPSCLASLRENQPLPEFAAQQPETEQRLHRGRGDRQVPDLFDPEAGSRR